MNAAKKKKASPAHDAAALDKRVARIVGVAKPLKALKDLAWSKKLKGDDATVVLVAATQLHAQQDARGAREAWESFRIVVTKWDELREHPLALAFLTAAAATLASPEDLLRLEQVIPSDAPAALLARFVCGLVVVNSAPKHVAPWLKRALEAGADRAELQRADELARYLKHPEIAALLT